MVAHTNCPEDWSGSPNPDPAKQLKLSQQIQTGKDSTKGEESEGQEAGDGSEGMEGESADEELQCGLGPCHPRALQRCRRLIFFTVALAFAGLCTIMQGPLISSQVTSIERQFHINSAQLGALMSANDIGFLLFVLVVSHFAKDSHRPRLLACAAIVFGLASVIMGMLNFVNPVSIQNFDHRVNGSLQRGSDGHYLCLPGTDNTTSSQRKCAGAGGNGTGSADSSEGKLGLIVVLGLMLAIQGVTKATRSPLGVTYIDRNVSHPSRTGFHVGLMMTVVLFGPPLGLALGGAISRIPVDLSDTSMSSKDPRWIGAWWLGFLISGALTALSGLPLLLFPKRMPRARSLDDAPQGPSGATVKSDPRKVEADENVDINGEAKTAESGSIAKDADLESKSKLQIKLKELPRSLLRLLRNPVYVVLLLAMTAKMFAIIGFGTFLIKFVERQFGLTPSLSAYIFGLSNLVCSGLGTMIGGLLVSRGNLTRRGCLRWTLVAGTVSVVLSAVSLALGCDPDSGAILGLQQRSMKVDDGLSTCTCDWGQYLPVCDGNRTYLSPCHAGCKRAANATHFEDCSLTSQGHVVAGHCSSGCYLLIPFIVVQVLGNTFGASTITPMYITVLRTASEQDKVLGIGLLSFTTSIAAFIPAPIVYGAVIDASCLIWSSTCSAGTGPCSFYDVRRLRHNYLGLETGMKALAVTFFAVALGLLSWQVRTSRSTDDPPADKLVVIGSKASRKVQRQAELFHRGQQRREDAGSLCPAKRDAQEPKWAKGEEGADLSSQSTPQSTDSHQGGSLQKEEARQKSPLEIKPPGQEAELIQMTHM